MKIYAMFGVHKNGDDTPELLDAWDEYCREENPDGWDEAHDKWVKGSDLTAFAVVTFEVDEDAVHRALYPPPVEVPATVVKDRKAATR